MLLAVIAVVAGGAAGWLAGRRPPPARAGGLWKAPALVPVGIIAMVAGTRWLGGTPGWAAVAVGYGSLVTFAGVNSRRPGLALVGVGLLANLLVIVADRGMPVRSEPPGVQIGAHHHGLSGSDRLAGLADTVLISPLHETVSPGDLLAVGGGAVAAFFWLESGAGLAPGAGREADAGRRAGGGRQKRTRQRRAGPPRRDGLVRPS